MGSTFLNCHVCIYMYTGAGPHSISGCFGVAASQPCHATLSTWLVTIEMSARARAALLGELPRLEEVRAERRIATRLLEHQLRVALDRPRNRRHTAAQYQRGTMRRARMPM